MVDWSALDFNYSHWPINRVVMHHRTWNEEIREPLVTFTRWPGLCHGSRDSCILGLPHRRKRNLLVTSYMFKRTIARLHGRFMAPLCRVGELLLSSTKNRGRFWVRNLNPFIIFCSANEIQLFHNCLRKAQTMTRLPNGKRLLGP